MVDDAIVVIENIERLMAGRKPSAPQAARGHSGGVGRSVAHLNGTAVFGGMLVSLVVNLVFIPSLYVLMQKRRGAATRTVRDEGPVKAPSH